MYNSYQLRLISRIFIRNVLKTTVDQIHTLIKVYLSILFVLLTGTL